MDRTEFSNFGLIFNASQTSMAITERHTGRIMDVNSHWTKMSGLSRAQSIGKTGAELKLWTNMGERQTLMAMLAEHGVISDYPVKFNMLKGTQLHLVSARIFQDVAHECILWELKDVSFLAEAQSRLNERESRYQTIVDNTHDAVQVFSLDGTPVRVNAAWERLWGVPFAALEKYNILRDVQLKDSGMLDLIKQAFQGKAVRLPATRYDKSKSDAVQGQSGQLWIEAFIYPVFGDNGKVFEVVVMQQEVSARIQRDQERGLENELLERTVRERTLQLQQQHNRLETILNGIPGVVGYWDQQERNVYANAGYKEWLGVAGEQMLGKTIREVFGEQRYGLMQAKVQAVLRGEPQDFEGVYPDPLKSGEARYAEIHYVPEWHDGAVIGFFVLAFDISKLRRLAEESKASSLAKSAFLSNMSHEIRTPLNAMIGMAYMLKTTTLNATQGDYVSKMESASHHLMEIVNDILDLSKIEAEKLSLESRAFNIATLVGNVASMLTDRAAEKQIVLRTDVDLDQLNYSGDPTRLQQVLLNFGSNAIKFSNQGEICISVSLEAQQAARTTLRFRVRDQGIGIPASALGKLFHAFEQADSSTTRKYGGTGLGLAICKRIAELMGGEVGVESAPGQGSTFWFTAQLENVYEESEQESQLWRESVKSQLLQQFQGTKVLVADDEPVNLEIASFLLEDIGFVVEAADDGAQAVEVAQQQTHDLVLLDMQMPRMDGLEAARRIKGLPVYERVPIVAMSGNVFREDRERCAAVGMEYFVPKPIETDDFYHVIWQALTRQ